MIFAVSLRLTVTLDGSGNPDHFFTAIMVKYYLPHIVFFSVFLAALLPVLYYYQRRNPHPRFRPGMGEMTLIVVFALSIGGAACFMLGNVFRGDQNLRQFMGRPDEGAGWSSGTTGPQKKEEDSRYPRKD